MIVLLALAAAAAGAASLVLARRVAEQRRLLSEAAVRHGCLVARMPAASYVAATWDDLAARRLSADGARLEAMTRLPREEWLAAVHPEDREELAAALAEACALRIGFEAEYRVTRADGAVAWLRETCEPVYAAHADASSEPLYLQGFVLDVSEQRRAELERAQLELELRLAQKLEAVGQLAAGIAHEINTPVQFVSDSVRFLHDCFADLVELVAAYRAVTDELGDALPADARTRLAEAEEVAELDYIRERAPEAFGRTFDGLARVARIVRAMKEFAHPPAAEQAPADLNAAIESTLVVATNELKYVADVETDLGDLPPVVCHLSDLNQVFLNLVVNAAHAMSGLDEGKGRGKIVVRTRCEGDDAVVEIEDTGCGIPEELRERIFEPFFTTKGVGRGTGQGLALARAVVVERHGGTLDYVSRIGVGTTFVIRIPLAGLAVESEALAA